MNHDKRELVFQYLKSVDELTDMEKAGACEPTIDTIALASGLTPDTVRNNLAKLEKAGRAYILMHGRRRAPVWVKGKGISASKPPSRSDEEALVFKRERAQVKRGSKPRVDKDTQLRSRTRELTEATVERTRRQPMQWYSWLEQEPTA